MYTSGSTSVLASSTNNLSDIRFVPSKAFSVLLQTTTQSKMAYGFYLYNNDIYLFYRRWNNTTTVWASLGTLNIDRTIGTVYVLVRRIL